MNYEDFVLANEHNIYEDYEESVCDDPYALSRLREWDVDSMWDWVYSDKTYYTEVMHDLYEDYIHDELFVVDPRAKNLETYTEQQKQEAQHARHEEFATE